MRTDLIDDIDDFCARHGMSDSQFGRMALNNPAFVGRVRGLYDRPPLDPRRSTVDRVYDWMDAYDREHPAPSGKRQAIQAA